MKSFVILGFVALCCFIVACETRAEGETTSPQLTEKTERIPSPTQEELLPPPMPPPILASFNMKMPLTYEVFTPQVALQAVMSSPLHHLGVDEPDEDGNTALGSIAPNCLWHNNHVMVLSRFCYPHDERAATFTVYSLLGDSVDFYADTLDSAIPVESVKKEGYGIFRVSYNDLSQVTPKLEPGMTLESFTAFHASDRQSFTHEKGTRTDCGFCMVNGYGGKEVETFLERCNDKVPEPAANKWIEASKAFLNDPGDEWYQFLKTLNKLGKEYGPPDAERYGE